MNGANADGVGSLTDHCFRELPLIALLLGKVSWATAEAVSKGAKMKPWSIGSVILLGFLSCSPRVASASSCLLSDPLYQLFADTANGSTKIASSQYCTHGLRVDTVAIKNAELISYPQFAKVTVRSPSLTYAARSEFRVRESFAREVTGSKTQIHANSAIRLNLVAAGAPASGGLVAVSRNRGAGTKLEGLAGAASTEPLPEGNSGIAARYPGDAGIGSHPNVIFADDFESYRSAVELTSKWNHASHYGDIRIATESDNVFAGSKALEFTVPKQTSPSGQGVVKFVNPERDILFLRYYIKIASEYDAMGSTHIGGTISSRYCCPGERANGHNKYLIALEPSRDDAATPNPGSLNMYVYHPEQRDIWGDHIFPTGRVVPNDALRGDFGPDFVARPEIIPPLGRWYCNELMVKANTPDQRDGRVAAWLDGKLIADFGNLRLRDTNELTIDRFMLNSFIYRNTSGLAKVWFDNVVAASTYIGPMVPATH